MRGVSVTNRGCVWVLATLLVSCAARAPVKIDHDPLYDFSRLRSWAWAPGRPQVVPDDGDAFLRSRLQSIPGLIERELALRGFESAGAREPDFLVAYNVASGRGRIDTFQDFGTYRLSGGSQDFGGSWVFGYEEGILTINVADAHTRQLVWQGFARAPLDDKLSESERAARLRRGIQDMFVQFPPKSGS